MKRKARLDNEPLQLGDPEPPSELRKKISIWMAPEITKAIDMRRRTQSRAMWIEEAVRERIRREDDRT